MHACRSSLDGCLCARALPMMSRTPAVMPARHPPTCSPMRLYSMLMGALYRWAPGSGCMLPCYRVALCGSFLVVHPPAHAQQCTMQRNSKPRPMHCCSQWHCTVYLMSSNSRCTSDNIFIIIRRFAWDSLPPAPLQALSPCRTLGSSV